MTNLELGDFMVVYALNINNILGVFMGDEAHITVGINAIGSPIIMQPGFMLQNGTLILTSVGCNHSMNLSFVLTGRSRRVFGVDWGGSTVIDNNLKDNGDGDANTFANDFDFRFSTF